MWTGEKAMSREHSPSRQGGPTPVAFTIAEFCETHRLSRSKLYQMWNAGTGPRKMQIGSKILISVEAAADWRREREAASAAEAA
jgi:predicted DNA-binding transcriptional regulator AlpA